MTNRHRGKTKTRKFNKTPEIRFNIVDENGNRLTVKNPSEIFNSSSESSSGFHDDYPPADVGVRLARGSNIIRGCLGTIARILSETHSYYNDWVVIDNSIDIFESSGVTEEPDGLYYNGIKIASFIRDGVWIRENAEDYHQVFFKDAGIGIDNIPVYVSIVVCKDPVVYYQDIIHEITSGGQY